MSQRSEETISYYNTHAEEYAERTVALDMDSLRQSFLEVIPSGGRILDAGCGSGRDSRVFKDQGYSVTAIDASVRMAEIASKLLRQSVNVVRLQQLHFNPEFDGIWACASVLHVPLAELDDVFQRFSQALKSGGICFVSFKNGSGERFDGDRHFSDFNSVTLRNFLARQDGFRIRRIWTSSDQQARPGVSWVNALIQKEPGCLSEPESV